MIRIFCKICTKSFSFFVFDFIFWDIFAGILSKYFSLRTDVSIFSLLLLSLLKKKEKKKNDLKQSKLTEIMLMNLKFYLIIVYIYRNQ